MNWGGGQVGGGSHPTRGCLAAMEVPCTSSSMIRLWSFTSGSSSLAAAKPSAGLRARGPPPEGGGGGGVECATSERGDATRGPRKTRHKETQINANECKKRAKVWPQILPQSRKKMAFEFKKFINSKSQIIHTDTQIRNHKNHKKTSVQFPPPRESVNISSFILFVPTLVHKCNVCNVWASHVYMGRLVCGCSDRKNPVEFGNH